MVWRGRPRSGYLLGYRRLAAQRHSSRADPLGAVARSLPALRPAGHSLHRPSAGTAAKRSLVRLTLATRRHLPRGPRPPHVETQRQKLDKSVAYTTRCLFGPFAIVTLLASHLDSRVASSPPQAPETTRRDRPLPTALPQYGRQSGASRVSRCPGSQSMPRNSCSPPQEYHLRPLARRLSDQNPAKNRFF